MKIAQKVITITLCVAAIAGIIVLHAVNPAFSGDAAFDALLKSVLTYLITSAFMVAVTARFYPAIFKLKPMSAKTALWLLPAIAVAVVNFPFSALAGGTAAVVRPDLLWLLIIKCLLIGVTEELLFRAFLYVNVLDFTKKSKFNPLLSVVICSATFALFHLFNLLDGANVGATLLQVGYSFLTGAMFAAVFIKTEIIYLPVLLHAVFDVGGLLINDLGSGSPHDLIFWVLTAIAGVICAVHVIFTLIKLTRKQAENQADLPQEQQ